MISQILNELAPNERLALENVLLNPAFMILVKKMVAHNRTAISTIDPDLEHIPLTIEYKAIRNNLDFWRDMQQAISHLLQITSERTT